MKVRRKSEIAEAVKLDYFKQELWEITDAEGEKIILTTREFAAHYEPVPEPPAGECHCSCNPFCGCVWHGTSVVPPEVAHMLKIKNAHLEDDSVSEEQPAELCADCGKPKDCSTMHHDAPGTNWGAALHWFRDKAKLEST